MDRDVVARATRPGREARDVLGAVVDQQRADHSAIARLLDHHFGEAGGFGTAEQIVVALAPSLLRRSPDAVCDEVEQLSIRSEQRSLFDQTDADRTEVALFSGGLDSGAGLYVHHARLGRHMVAVSSCGNGVRGGAQTHAVEVLSSLLKPPRRKPLLELYDDLFSEAR